MLLAPLGTDLLSREHIFSHEVFDLLENKLTFSCLPEQSVLCWICDRPGRKHVKQPEGLNSMECWS